MSPLKDRSSVTLKTQSADLGEGVWWGNGEARTYSTSLDQDGGLLMVMNTQLVKMVIMINILNSVGEGSRKESERLGRGGHRKVSCPPPHPPPPPQRQGVSVVGRICVDQHLDSHPPDEAEGAQHVEGGRGRESEDGLSFVEHNEGLRQGENL